MNREETLEMARYITATGKMIHERVGRVQTAFLARNGRCRGFRDISAAQLYTVLTIHNQGPVSITGLAGLLGVSAPSASAMVERLVEKNLLTRQPNRTDRRRVEVRVSPSAVADIEQVEEAVVQTFAELVQRMGGEAARQWCQVLARIKEALEAEAPPG